MSCEHLSSRDSDQAFEVEKHHNKTTKLNRGNHHLREHQNLQVPISHLKQKNEEESKKDF